MQQKNLVLASLVLASIGAGCGRSEIMPQAVWLALTVDGDAVVGLL